MSKTSKILEVRPAGDEYQVVTVSANTKTYRRTPCPGCPWRVDQTGVFPADAFRHSASTAYDMAQSHFSCHESGTKKPVTCAGFLLHGAVHNLAVRLDYIRGHILGGISDGGHDLHKSYRAMAVANGVDAADPVLQACR